MAAYEEITIRLKDDYAAYARYWPAVDTRGAVLYHHGIQSHCGWYEASAARLAQAGYAVLQVDRRGCGRNQLARGHADSADELIADALVARDALARRSGFTDHHVVGISWGGKLAVAAYVADPAGVRSLSLVTPGLFPQVGVSKEEMSRIGFAMLYEPKSSFDIPLNAAELFTSEPRWTTFFDQDPRTLRQCTAGFYLASRRMDKTVARLPQAAPVPIHLLLAGVERIIDNEKTERFFRELNWPMGRVTHYADARHSLEFEQIHDAYCGTLTSFIDEAEANARTRQPC